MDNKLLGTRCCHLLSVAASLLLSLFTFTATSCDNLDDESFFVSIQGRVSDADTSEPLSGVSVTLTPSSNSQITKDDGTFFFENVDIQQYTLIFQKSGYQTNRKNVTTIVGEETHIDVSLEKIQQ